MSKESNPLSNVAVGEIWAILAQIHAVGGNDAEHPEVMGILTSLRNGILAPDDAVRRARSILESKSSGYH